jgi:hypothetical protein
MQFVNKHKNLSIVQQEREYMKKYGKYLHWWRTYSVETSIESKHFMYFIYLFILPIENLNELRTAP